MPKEDIFDIPARDPVTGQKLVVTELAAEDGSITIRGRFRIPEVARIDQNHREFLEVFLRSRGVISTVEKELGISYPTVRARLDALLEALDYKPIKEGKSKAKEAEAKRRILEQLEAGKITAEEAKLKLRGGAR